MKTIGDENNIQREVGTSILLLPLAHRQGSEELVEAVSRVDANLDPADQKRAIILAENYAPAGAIELLGDADLPPVYSPQTPTTCGGHQRENPRSSSPLALSPNSLRGISIA